MNWILLYNLLSQLQLLLGIEPLENIREFLQGQAGRFDEAKVHNREYDSQPDAVVDVKLSTNVFQTDRVHIPPKDRGNLDDKQSESPGLGAYLVCDDLEHVSDTHVGPGKGVKALEEKYTRKHDATAGERAFL